MKAAERVDRILSISRALACSYIVSISGHHNDSSSPRPFLCNFVINGVNFTIAQFGNSPADTKLRDDPR